MKEKVFQWIQQGCNFNEGLNLLAEIGKNKQLPRIMAGHENRYAGKLLYELCKAAGFSMSEFQQIKENLQQIVEQFNSQIEAGDPPVGDHPAEDPPGGDPPADPPQTDAPVDQLPEEVEIVTREHSDLYKLRAQLHEQMGNLPEENTEVIVKQRKNLSDSIAQLSPRIDLLFEAKEAFYTKGILPNMDILFPKPVSEQEPSLPDDADELKKMKKNLQSANTKDQNMLDYQETKKGAKPNPMQSGPKRMKIENRISERNEQIEKIDFKLLSCS
jgi:hypothetical protein